METAQEVSVFMVLSLTMKILLEGMPVQVFYQWQIVEEIQMGANFL